MSRPVRKHRPDPLTFSEDRESYATEATSLSSDGYWVDENGVQVLTLSQSEGQRNLGSSSSKFTAQRTSSPLPLDPLNDEQVCILEEHLTRGWVPLPLRTVFWVPFTTVMLLVAIGLEIALFVNERGWPVSGALTAQTGVMHYVYTVIPSAVAAISVALWAWTDIEIKKMQPYVDLIRGGAPPRKTLLLDYTRTNNYLVWISALRNKHYLVTLSTCLTLLLATFSPLASSVFAVKNTEWLSSPVTVSNRQVLSLNPALGSNANTSDRDLLSGAIVAAAGYAGAQAGFSGVPAPPFTSDGYTVGEFDIPPEFGSNGTVFANTTAVYTYAGCQPSTTPVNMTQLPNTTWVNTATYAGCTFTWFVNNTAPFLYGHSILDNTSQCQFDVEGGTAFAPVAFWFFTYEPTEMSNVAFCNSSIALYDVEVPYDIASGSISGLRIIGQFEYGSSNFSSLAANVTALAERGYNGWALPNTTPNPDDSTVTTNLATAQNQIPAAIFQAAVGSSSINNFTHIFQSDTFVVMANEVCTTFLSMIARSFYFVDDAVNMDVVVATTKLRLFLSPVATHLLAGALIILSFAAVILHINHTLARRDLNLSHQPGTIASAVSIAAKTPVADLLSPGPNQQSGVTDDELAQRLREMRFTMNPMTMKIVAEGEAEYEALQREKERRRRSTAEQTGLGGRRASLARTLSSVFTPVSPTSVSGSVRSRGSPHGKANSWSPEFSSPPPFTTTPLSPMRSASYTVSPTNYGGRSGQAHIGPLYVIPQREEPSEE